MRRLFKLSLFLFFTPLFAEDSRWFAFTDKQSERIGFKDQSGKIMIAPKFMGLTQAKKFDHIMAVMEEKDDNFIGYYLLKNGRQVGLNNLYIDQNNSSDCESENTIRFRDHKTRLVGFYDSQGKTKIPAMYSDALPFRNGLALVIKDAVRTCHDGSLYSEQNRCEHWMWRQGTVSLINQKNELLVENPKFDADVDWYSLKISRQEYVKPNWISISGTYGRFYNFIDMRGEFIHWLRNEFLPDINKQRLLEYSFGEITYWQESKGWLSETKGKFINKRSENILKELNRITLQPKSYFVSSGGLNPFIYSDAKYEAYFDNCGNAREWQYPVMSIIIDRTRNGKDFQNSFEFLRTPDGYRLISISLN